MRSRLLVLPASAILLLAATALSGCSSLEPGPPVSQERDITDVEIVELATSGDLTVALGATPSLTVTAGARVIDRLTADVTDGVLRLGMDGEPLLRDGEIRYELTVSSLESLIVRGSGDASIDLSGATAPSIMIRDSGDVDATGIEATDAVLTIDGSGEIEVHDAAVEMLAVRIEGSGGVTMNGTATTQRVEIGGAGGYEAEGLHSADAFVSIRGSGSVAVTAERTLEAVIDGSGDISYSGDARVSKEVSGSGDVTRR